MRDWGEKENRRNGFILCGLVFFVIAATVFCMIADGRETAKEQAEIAAEKKAEEAAEKARKKAEEAAEKARKKAEEQRKLASSVQPGVPVGTTEVNDNEKVIW